MSNVNLIPVDNEIVLVNLDRAIVITDQDAHVQVEVTQPVTSVVQILTGPIGPSGLNAFPFTGSAVISGSLTIIGNEIITGSLFLISGSYSGSGANLFNIPASAIVGLNLSRITTGSITASVNITEKIFLVQSSSIDMFKVQDDRVVVLASSLTIPTPISGGIYFSASGDFFFGS